MKRRVSSVLFKVPWLIDFFYLTRRWISTLYERTSELHKSVNILALNNLMRFSSRNFQEISVGRLNNQSEFLCRQIGNLEMLDLPNTKSYFPFTGNLLIGRSSLYYIRLLNSFVRVWMGNLSQILGVNWLWSWGASFHFSISKHEILSGFENYVLKF